MNFPNLEAKKKKEKKKQPECEKQYGIYPLPDRCLLMIFAVSLALAMLEWIRMSYLSPNAAKRWPVNSACSRPGERTRQPSLHRLQLITQCLKHLLYKVQLSKAKRIILMHTCKPPFQRYIRTPQTVKWKMCSWSKLQVR